MPKAKQISAWVEDRPGVLGQVADALGEKGISIRAFIATAFEARGFIRLVCDQPGPAKRVLKKQGWEVTEEDVLEVTLPDRPGALGAVADKLGAAGVNVSYAYVGTAKSASKVNLYLAVEDVKAAMRALR